MANKTVLVVDDNPDIRRAVVAALKGAGEDYFLMDARNGQVALDFLKRFHFDVVVTDYEMGDINGLDVLEEAKKLYPDCDVIMLTAFATGELAREVLRNHQRTHFLIKPLDVQKLRDKVKSCFESKAVRQDVEKTHSVLDQFKDKDTPA
ncbi:MAG: response regulator [Elusimicrobia bacterium]|nr:response regulator [Elusimicrobiota bacterium]